MSRASIAAAEDVARRALEDAGIPLASDDSLPSRLVAIAGRYDLPPHVLVLWIQQTRREQIMNPEDFESYCHEQRGGVSEKRTDEAGICQQCFRHPVRVIGGMAVCTSGRCVPQVPEQS